MGNVFWCTAAAAGLASTISSGANTVSWRFMWQILPRSADIGSDMRDGWVRGLGLATTAVYAAAIGWLYARQPQTMAEMTGALTASVGAYRVDAEAFQRGRDLFRSEQFEAARLAFDRADPARQDPTTQFYI